MPSDLQPTVDVAVVGGGVSGLYAAWRLLSSPPGVSPVVDRLACQRGGTLSVSLFEAEPRLGGRLLSVVPAKGMAPLDLGALRYRASHHRVRSLVEDVLHLPVVPHVVGADQVLYPRPSEYRGRRSPEDSELRPAGRAHESPAVTAVGRAIESVLGRDPRTIAHDDWLAVRKEATWQGRPLTSWAWWDLLKAVMPSGEYRQVTAAAGYATTMGDWNAADALAWYGADIAGDNEYRRPVEGMQAITRALAHRVIRAGGVISCNRQLDGITVTSTNSVCLRFRAPPGRCVEPPLGRSSLVARHVVLALPPRALSHLIDTGEADLLAAPTVRHMIDAVTAVPMLTICCCYPRPWWRDRTASRRAPLRPSPLGQVLALEQPGHEMDQTAGFALTAYNNAATIGHWKALMSETGGPRSRPGNRWVDYKAPDRLAADFHRQLRVALDVPPEAAEPPPPYSTVCKDWSADPFGGECHAWKVHQHSWLVSRSVMQPHADAPVHICGEAYSLQQGWIEGALEHTEHLLDAVFAIPTFPERTPVAHRVS